VIIIGTERTVPSAPQPRRSSRMATIFHFYRRQPPLLFVAFASLSTSDPSAGSCFRVVLQVRKQFLKVGTRAKRVEVVIPLQVFDDGNFVKIAGCLGLP
jgi:hypothetical protein